MNQAPVGIFDSGVGGLSVLQQIHQALPTESVYYVADSANAPWGDKPAAFVRERGLKIARFLISQGVKAIVIGSNTGTAGSAEALRAAGAPVTTVDVLPDPTIRQELSEVSGWPTIPQLFVKGELVGGADITQELAESGELRRILEEKLGAGYGNGAEERVIDVLSGTRA